MRLVNISGMNLVPRHQCEIQHHVLSSVKDSSPPLPRAIQESKELRSGNGNFGLSPSGPLGGVSQRLHRHWLATNKAGIQGPASKLSARAPVASSTRGTLTVGPAQLSALTPSPSCQAWKVRSWKSLKEDLELRTRGELCSWKGTSESGRGE